MNDPSTESITIIGRPADPFNTENWDEDFDFEGVNSNSEPGTPHTEEGLEKKQAGAVKSSSMSHPTLEDHRLDFDLDTYGDGRWNRPLHDDESDDLDWGTDADEDDDWDAEIAREEQLKSGHDGGDSSVNSGGAISLGGWGESDSDSDYGDLQVDNMADGDPSGGLTKGFKQMVQQLLLEDTAADEMDEVPPEFKFLSRLAMPTTKSKFTVKYYRTPSHFYSFEQSTNAHQPRLKFFTFQELESFLSTFVTKHDSHFALDVLPIYTSSFMDKKCTGSIHNSESGQSEQLWYYRSTHKENEIPTSTRVEWDWDIFLDLNGPLLHTLYKVLDLLNRLKLCYFYPSHDQSSMSLNEGSCDSQHCHTSPTRQHILSQSLWKVLHAAFRYIDRFRDFHGSSVDNKSNGSNLSDVFDSEELYLVLQDILLAAAQTWTARLAKSFNSLIAKCKKWYCPSYGGLFDLLEVETVAHHDGTHANKLFRMLCQSYKYHHRYLSQTFSSINSVSSQNPSLNLSQPSSQVPKGLGVLATSPAKNETYQSMSASPSPATSPPHSRSPSPSRPQSLSSSSFSSTSKSSLVTNSLGEHKPITIAYSHAQQISNRIATRAIISLEFYLNNISPLTSDPLSEEADWDHEADEFLWLEQAWAGRQPPAGSKDLEKLTWKLCHSAQTRIALIRSTYGQLPLGSLKAKAAYVLALHNLRLVQDEEIGTQVHNDPKNELALINEAESLLFEALFILDQIATQEDAKAIPQSRSGPDHISEEHRDTVKESADTAHRLSLTPATGATQQFTGSEINLPIDTSLTADDDRSVSSEFEDWDAEINDQEHSTSQAQEAEGAVPKVRRDSSSKNTGVDQTPKSSRISCPHQVMHVVSEFAINVLTLYGDTTLMAGKYEYAILAYEAACSAYRRVCGRPFHALHRRLCSICIENDDIPRAIAYHHKILLKAQRDGELVIYVYIVKQLSKLYSLTAEYDGAEYVLGTALTFLRAIAHPSSLPVTLAENHEADHNLTLHTQSHTVSKCQRGNFATLEQISTKSRSPTAVNHRNTSLPLFAQGHIPTTPELKRMSIHFLQKVSSVDIMNARISLLLVLARLYLKADHNEQAVKLLVHLKACWTLPRSKTHLVDILLATAYLDLHQFDQAEELLQKIENTATSEASVNNLTITMKPTDSSHIKALLPHLGTTSGDAALTPSYYMDIRTQNYLFSGNLEKALVWVSSAINDCKKSNLSMRGRWFYRKGVILQQILLRASHNPYPNPKLCSRAFREALGYFVKVDDAISEGNAIGKLAAVYLHVPFIRIGLLGESPSDLAAWLQAAHLVDQKQFDFVSSSGSSIDSDEGASAAQDLAFSNFLTELDGLAQQALEISSQSLRPVAILQCYLNVAEIRYLQGRSDSSILYWLECKNAFQAMFMNGPCVIVNHKISPEVLLEVKHILYRLVRLLFCFDCYFINQHLLILDAYSLFEMHNYAKEYNKCRQEDTSFGLFSDQSAEAKHRTAMNRRGSNVARGGGYFDLKSAHINKTLENGPSLIGLGQDDRWIAERALSPHIQAYATNEVFERVARLVEACCIQTDELGRGSKKIDGHINSQRSFSMADKFEWNHKAINRLLANTEKLRKLCCDRNLDTSSISTASEDCPGAHIASTSTPLSAKARSLTCMLPSNHSRADPLWKSMTYCFRLANVMVVYSPATKHRLVRAFDKSHTVSAKSLFALSSDIKTNNGQRPSLLSSKDTNALISNQIKNRSLPSVPFIQEVVKDFFHDFPKTRLFPVPLKEIELATEWHAQHSKVHSSTALPSTRMSSSFIEGSGEDVIGDCGSCGCLSEWFAQHDWSPGFCRNCFHVHKVRVSVDGVFSDEKSTYVEMKPERQTPPTAPFLSSDQVPNRNAWVPKRIVVSQADSLLPPSIDIAGLIELFKCLSPASALQLLTSILNECKIVIVSNSFSRIWAVTHCLTRLLYPFRWQHMFLPLLTPDVISILHFQQPFLVGVHQTVLDSAGPLGPDVVIADLDYKTVKFRPGTFIELPTKCRSKISKAFVNFVSTMYLLKVIKKTDSQESNRHDTFSDRSSETGHPKSKQVSRNMKTGVFLASLSVPPSFDAMSNIDSSQSGPSVSCAGDADVTADAGLSSPLSTFMIGHCPILSKKEILACLVLSEGGTNMEHSKSGERFKPKHILEEKYKQNQRAVVAAKTVRDAILDVYVSLIYKYELWWNKPNSSSSCVSTAIRSSLGHASSLSLSTGPVSPTIRSKEGSQFPDIESLDNLENPMSFDMYQFLRHTKQSYRPFLQSFARSKAFRHFIQVKYDLHKSVISKHIFDLRVESRLLRKYQDLNHRRSVDFEGSLMVARGSNSLKKRWVQLVNDTLKIFKSRKGSSLKMSWVLVPDECKLVIPLAESDSSHFTFMLSPSGALQNRRTGKDAAETWMFRSERESTRKSWIRLIRARLCPEALVHRLQGFKQSTSLIATSMTGGRFSQSISGQLSLSVATHSRGLRENTNKDSSLGLTEEKGEGESW